MATVQSSVDAPEVDLLELSVYCPMCVSRCGARPFGPESANLNLLLRQSPSDRVSGSAPLRASLCEITRE